MASSPLAGPMRSLGSPRGGPRMVRQARPGHARRSRSDAVQKFRGVAAEDLPDLGGREPAVSQEPGQVGELVVAGQDGPVVAVQVGADSHVAGPGDLGQPDDLGAEIGQGPAGQQAGQAPIRPPAAATAATCAVVSNRGWAVPTRPSWPCEMITG